MRVFRALEVLVRVLATGIGCRFDRAEEPRLRRCHLIGEGNDEVVTMRVGNWTVIASSTITTKGPVRDRGGKAIGQRAPERIVICWGQRREWVHGGMVLHQFPARGYKYV